MNYSILMLYYPNWKPEDMKKMTSRERKYWLETGEYVAERRKRK